MSISLLRTPLLVASVLAATYGIVCAEPPSKKPRERAAARLVTQALDAELSGDADRRRALLAEALRVEPEYSPARWQSGQIRFDGRWRSVDEIAELVSQDRRWQEYRRLRASMTGTVEDHLALARWCRRNRLGAEERFHWVNVLLTLPNQKEAQQRLRLREYRGGLYTYEQVARHKQFVKEAKKKFAQLKPVFLRYRREAVEGDALERQAALAKLSAVADLSAIQALVYATTVKRPDADDLVHKLGRDEAQRLIVDLNLAFISALGNMPEHEATVRLVNQAVFSPFDEVRHLAAEALKPRSKTSYVPLLMSGLAAPVEAQFDLDVFSGGSVMLIEKLYQKGPEGDLSQVNTRTYQSIALSSEDRWRDGQEYLAKDMRRAADQARGTAHTVESANARARRRNERIAEVLKTTTGLAAGPEPEAWWTAWQQYNELSYPEDKPVHETRYYMSRYRTYGDESRGEGNSSCCFVAGTPVWAQRGRVPIEQVAVGDLVLCQDPVSGQLAYRPVLRTTTRPPSPTVRITLPGATTTASRGHRFWVNGRGWQMAKFLKAGTWLHCLDRPLEIESVEDGDDVAAHGLVVGEFKTYFVGNSGVLVHDNACPRPTLAPVPGMASSRTTSELSAN